MTKEHWQAHPNQRRVTDIEREEIEKLFRLNVPFRNIRSEVTDSTGKVLTDNDLRNIALQQKHFTLFEWPKRIQRQFSLF